MRFHVPFLWKKLQKNCPKWFSVFSMCMSCEQRQSKSVRQKCCGHSGPNHKCDRHRCCRIFVVWTLRLQCLLQETHSIWEDCRQPPRPLTGIKRKLRKRRFKDQAFAERFDNARSCLRSNRTIFVDWDIYFEQQHCRKIIEISYHFYFFYWSGAR